MTKTGYIEKPDTDRTGPIIPEYISVLAQATKVGQATTRERFLNFLSSSAEGLQNPTLLKLPKKGGETMIREYANTLGMNPMELENESDFQDIVESEQEAMAEREMEEEQMQQAQMAKDLSQAKLAGGEESLLDQEVEGQQAV